ncbi:MAG TPA: glycosyltransferase family 39 protein, partial [Anaerolineales bacterium]
MRFQPRTALIYALLILAIAVPRLSGLDRFVTVDEPKWLARAGNFYLALAQGDLANTFTREHPGVMVTWAGTVGLLWRYPEYKSNAPGYLTDSRQVEPLIREHGLEPIKVLAAARMVMVLLVTFALVGSFWASTQLIGLWPSFVGFLFIAFDPFYLGLSRLLHLDGLMSSLVLLSLLAFLNYLQPHSPHKNTSLMISAIAAGLAWLTKSPAIFLIPFLGL